MRAQGVAPGYEGGLTDSVSRAHTSHPTPDTTADGLLEGPTAVSCEKGGRPMSVSPLPSVRKEVQDYLNSCEHLLAATTRPTTPRFSKHELELLEYYASEIAEKILLHQVQNK